MSHASQGEVLLNQFVNFERVGIPKGAGAAGPDGFPLERMHRLLKALASPQAAWPVVHVAGSKGKGSTATMLAAILQHSGYRVGLYTSPHVTTLRERIQVDSMPISEPEFDALVDSHSGVLRQVAEQEQGHLSHFEVTTALAFQHFKDRKVDIAVVEVGLGGARDATNVFSPERLKLSIITALGREHEQALGGSLATIATAKAGIMKPGRPVVIADQSEAEAKAVLLDAARSLGCAVTQPQEVCEVSPSAGHGPPEQCGIYMEADGARQVLDIRWRQEQMAPQRVIMRLIGQRQADNVATASAAAIQLHHAGMDKISWQSADGGSVAAGLQQAFLPGRFQVCKLSLDNTQAPAPLIVLDGAHTVASAEALAVTLRQAFPQSPVALVMSMADDKDHRGVAKALRSVRPTVVVFTSVPIASGLQRSASPGVLAANWQAAGMSGAPVTRARELIQSSLRAAVQKAQAELACQDRQGVICLTGSMYIVAEALKTLQLTGAGVV